MTEVNNYKNIIDNELEVHNAQADAHMQKGDIEYSKLIQLVININILIMRKSGKILQEGVMTLNVSVHKDAQNVKNNIGSIGGKIFTIIKAVAVTASGAVGITIDATAFTWVQPLGTFGNGVGVFGELFNEAATARRTGYEFALTEDRRTRDNYDSDIKQTANRQHELLRELNDLNARIHQVSNSML